jgi:hypothetical protein
MKGIRIKTADYNHQWMHLKLIVSMTNLYQKKDKNSHLAFNIGYHLRVINIMIITVFSKKFVKTFQTFRGIYQNVGTFCLVWNKFTKS